MGSAATIVIDPVVTMSGATVVASCGGGGGAPGAGMAGAFWGTSAGTLADSSCPATLPLDVFESTPPDRPSLIGAVVLYSLLEAEKSFWPTDQTQPKPRSNAMTTPTAATLRSLTVRGPAALGTAPR